MSGQITITIRLGNDAMQDAVDVAGLLQRLVDRHHQRGVPDFADSTLINIPLFDVNGNTVGVYEYRRAS